MPSLQEIERFKGILNSLGSEAEILAERGEAIEELPPPEAGPPDLSDLFEGAQPGPPAAASTAGEEPGEEPGAGPGQPAGEEAGEGAGAEPGVGDFDFGNLFGQQGAEGGEGAEGAEDLDRIFAGLAEEGAAGGQEPAGEPSGELAGEPAAFEPAPFETTPPEMAEAGPAGAPGEAEEAEASKTLEEFGIPSGLLESLGEPVRGEAEEAAEEAGEDAGTEEAAAGEAEEAGEEAGAGAPTVGPAAEEELTDFTLPADFGIHEEGMQEEEAAVPEAPLPAAGAAEGPGEEPVEWPAPEGGAAEAAETAEAPQGGLPEDIFAEPSAPAGEEAGALPADFLSGLGVEAPAPAEEAATAEAPPGLGEEPFQLPEEFMLPPEPPAAESPAGEAPATEVPEGGAPGMPEEPFAFPEMPSLEPPESPHPEAIEEPAGTGAEAGAGGEGISELPEGFTGEGLFGEEAPAEAAAETQAPAAAAAAAPLRRAERPAKAEEAPRPEGPAPAADELGLTERRFAFLQRTLSSLPRNLKMAIEELIAEKGLTGPDLRLLTGLLADGEAPARIAEEVSRIIGRRIRLPRGYEKLSGLAFEEERRRFGFALRENVWPVVRAAVLSLLFLGLLSFLGYRYIYRPVAAYVLYRQGHAQIAKDRYKLAEERFAKANAIIRYKRWYLRYAEAYAGRRQYPLAADKYELLLQHFPLDRQGILAYAGLLTYSTFGYERAERILGEYIGEYEVDQRLRRYVPRAGFRDADILLARGDNFLEWAEERPEHFESARMQYATILDYYGERDQVLLRMMRYFIRVSPQKSRLKETQDLYRLLEEKDRKRRLEVAPELLASVYSELAGFWFDQQAYDGVRDALLAAMKHDKFYPEAHYQLARYYRYLPDAVEERKALVNAIQLLEDSSPFTRRRLLALIDSYNRLGESYWRDREQLNAERYYQRAIERIESAQAQRVLGRIPELGLPYKNRGDIYYYISGDWNTAFELYSQAEANQYRSNELDYKMGRILYVQQDFERALQRFSRVVDAAPANENGLFALGTALYLQGYFASAQGYYLRLLELLELRRDRIPFLEPAGNSEHRALLEYLMKVFNNLGVTTMRLSERGRDPARQARALANMTFSMEYFDVLKRNPETGERPQPPIRDLGYLNQQKILYPTRNSDLGIYDRLPLDLAASRF